MLLKLLIFSRTLFGLDFSLLFPNPPTLVGGDSVAFFHNHCPFLRGHRKGLAPIEILQGDTPHALSAQRLLWAKPRLPAIKRNSLSEPV